MGEALYRLVATLLPVGHSVDNLELAPFRLLEHAVQVDMLADAFSAARSRELSHRGSPTAFVSACPTARSYEVG